MSVIDENGEVLPAVTSRQDLALARDPAGIVQDARRAAQVLADVLRQKRSPVMFNGEQYLEFEDWQTVGRFYGVAAKVESTRFIEFDGARGFEARAVVINTLTGEVVSAAEAMCLSDEKNWHQRSLNQIRSMSQTRACAKALRNVLSWVVVLAGYRPTPAEEVEPVAASGQASRTGGSRPANAAADPLACECGKGMSAGQVAYSETHFDGRRLCPQCQRQAKAGESAPARSDKEIAAAASRQKRQQETAEAAPVVAANAAAQMTLEDSLACEGCGEVLAAAYVKHCRAAGKPVWCEQCEATAAQGDVT